jgi:hypothetical protein
MVLDNRLAKALADRDVIEPLEWEARVHTGASLRYRPDDMRRGVSVPQLAIATTRFPYIAPLYLRSIELLECEAYVTGLGL